VDDYRWGTTRVLVVDDHRMFAESLVHRLEFESDLAVLASVHTIADAAIAVTTLSPDVVLLDYSLPDGNGVDLARRIVAEREEIRVVMLTGVAGEAEQQDAIDAGCTAVITKDRAAYDVVRTIRAVTADLDVDQESVLTEREIEVLNLLADGLSSRGISERLYISLNTSRNHVQHVLAKLGVHSRLEAVAIGRRMGIVRGISR
jgi:DNA-binding NarL/FixJ family response regulator